MGLCMCRPRLARDHVSLLVHVPLFAELGPADLAAVASQVTVERFAKGECVFAESDLGDCMYVVASGRVRVTAQDVEGQDQLLAEWHPPMFFGEMSLLRDGKRAATVVSMSSRTALLCLTRAKLMQCAKQPWARHVLSRLQDTASHRMAQHLREVEFLAGLDANQLGTLASLCSLLRLAQGCYVFRAGDKGDAFYIVLRGRVEVMTQDAAGQERHLVTMGSGHYFGEMSLLDNIPRTASVRAQEPASLLALPADAFRNFLNLAPELRPRLQATVRHRSAGQLKDLQLPLFHGLTDQQLLALGDACTTRAVPAGELALQQGKPASEFHIVVHGSLQVEVAGAAGEPARVVSTLGAGDYFVRAPPVHCAAARGSRGPHCCLLASCAPLAVSRAKSPSCRNVCPPPPCAPPSTPPRCASLPRNSCSCSPATPSRWVRGWPAAVCCRRCHSHHSRHSRHSRCRPDAVQSHVHSGLFTAHAPAVVHAGHGPGAPHRARSTERTPGE